MAAIADFTLLPRTMLPELANVADQAGLQKLLEKGKSLPSFNWPGWVFYPVFTYLEREIGMDRKKFEFAQLSEELRRAPGIVCEIFGLKEKNEFLAKLAPQSFEPEVLQEFASQVNKANVPDAGEAMLAGIRALQNGLSKVDEGNVLVLSVSPEA
jgi:hypothetical protein